MGNNLRIAFALGGGVSLGTFSSAATAEVLKQALAYPGSDGREHFDSVEVDVLSGASAGSISLALFLRFLNDPGFEPDRSTWTSLPAESTEERLRSQFPGFDLLSEARQQTLREVQKAQDLLQGTWVDELDLGPLLGPDAQDQRDDVRRQAGVLDRRRIEALAERLLLGQNGEVPSRSQALARWVLFAVSLTRLTASVADARTEFADSLDQAQAAVDALTSRTFDDLRIFDLHFEPQQAGHFESEPERWFRCHMGPSLNPENKPPVADLRLEETWSQIGATALASGAVPMVFEPIVLERRRHEMETWPEELKDKEQYPFSYVDGGTFRNEPLREAFRLASFFDQQEAPGSIQRWVVFIDPLVGGPDTNLRLPFLQTLESRKRGKGRAEVEERHSIDRLIPHVATLFGAILDQARIIESDRAYRTLDRFQVRKEARQALRPLLSGAPSNEPLADLLQNLLARKQRGAALPTGSLDLEEALHRIRQEEGGGDSTQPPTLVESLFLLIDLLLDLDRKDEEALLVDIAPALRSLEDSERTIFLEMPAALYGGFAGFASATSRETSRSLGRLCAIDRLRHHPKLGLHEVGEEPSLRELIESRFDLTSGKPEETYWNDFAEEFKASLPPLGRRLEELLSDGRLSGLPALIAGPVTELIGELAKTAVEQFEVEPPKEVAPYELRIQVPSQDFELDTPGVVARDQKPIALEEGLFLVVHARFDHRRTTDEDAWEAPQLREGMLKIYRNTLLGDQIFCSLALPSPSTLEEAKLQPYPILEYEIFDQDEGSQQPVSPRRWEIASGAQPLVLQQD